MTLWIVFLSSNIKKHLLYKKTLILFIQESKQVAYPKRSVLLFITTSTRCTSNSFRLLTYVI